MQRELKFRAWDNKLKKWIVEGFHIFGETTLFDLIGQHCFETKGEGDSLSRYSDIEVTQYTGQVDSTGREIYEGDLIRIGAYIFELRFEDATFVCYHAKEEWGKWGSFYRLSQLDFGKYAYEVIGNIWQNSDFLTPQIPHTEKKNGE